MQAAPVDKWAHPQARHTSETAQEGAPRKNNHSLELPPPTQRPYNPHERDSNIAEPWNTPEKICPGSQDN